MDLHTIIRCDKNVKKIMRSVPIILAIDQDNPVNSGNKINSKEVAVGGNNGKSKNNNENNLLNNDKWYVKDGITYSRATGKPRTIEEAVGNLKIVDEKTTIDEDGTLSIVNVLDNAGNKWRVSIFNGDISLLIDKDGRKIRVGNTTETAEQLIAQANMKDNVSRRMGAIK